MAVQAQYLAHAFRHDPRSAPRPSVPSPHNDHVYSPLPCVSSYRPALLDDDATAASSVLLGDPGAHLLAQLQSRGNTTVLSELTSRNDIVSGCGFAPRKRARVGDADAGACGLIVEGKLLPAAVPVPLAFAGDVQCREHGSGAASTSGRLLSQLHRHGVVVDALVRVQVSCFSTTGQDQSIIHEEHF